MASDYFFCVKSMRSDKYSNPLMIDIVTVWLTLCHVKFHCPFEINKF